MVFLKVEGMYDLRDEQWKRIKGNLPGKEVAGVQEIIENL